MFRKFKENWSVGCKNDIFQLLKQFWSVLFKRSYWKVVFVPFRCFSVQFIIGGRVFFKNFFISFWTLTSKVSSCFHSEKKHGHNKKNRVHAPANCAVCRDSKKSTRTDLLIFHKVGAPLSQSESFAIATCPNKKVVFFHVARIKGESCNGKTLRKSTS